MRGIELFLYVFPLHRVDTGKYLAGGGIHYLDLIVRGNPLALYVDLVRHLLRFSHLLPPLSMREKHTQDHYTHFGTKSACSASRSSASAPRPRGGGPVSPLHRRNCVR